MDTEFDMNNWGNVVVKLKERYPQLTNADLIWRHETQDDFFKIIATELGITKSELKLIIEQLSPPKVEF